jgi:hypothetical protein
MPNSRWRQSMRKLLLFCLIPISIHATPVIAQTPGPAAADDPNPHLSPAILDAQFAKLQQIARPDDLAFELRLVDEAEALLGQQGDGIVRLPQDWALAAPDRETLDFLMLLGLADALEREPTRQEPSITTKIVTGTIGFIGASVADKRRRTALPFPHFESHAPIAGPSPALRALTWTTATGGCEARIVAGLHKLEATAGPIGRDARQILKALGPVAWTPNDRCGPPPG